MAEDVTLPFMYSPFFLICVEVYFVIMTILVIRYAIRSKNQPDKKDHPEYFTNEILVGILYFMLVLVYPFIFGFVTNNAGVKAQMYFHCWDSFTVHFIVWIVICAVWTYKNNKHNYHPTFDEWKIEVIDGYKDTVRADIKRKTFHFLPSVFIVAFYYIGELLEPLISEGYWTGQDFALFLTICVGLHFLLALSILDLLRLGGWFKYLGKFALDATRARLRPDEAVTFNSGLPMILTYIPFIFTFPTLLFAVALISSLSDAAASIVGKRFGKVRSKKEGEKKTREGYIAGFITTYLLVFLANLLLPFPIVGNNLIALNTMGLGAAIGFLLVDRYVRRVSDNIANTLVTGVIIYGVYLVFSII